MSAWPPCSSIASGRRCGCSSDPTILYGIGGGKTVWNRPILRSEIAQKTAHNTYQIDGLPPTPICNPGKAAIEAVLNPADTKDLYFVADGNGGHVFSETLKDHNTNVQKWRAFEKEMKAKAGIPSPAGGYAHDAPRPSRGRRFAHRPPCRQGQGRSSGRAGAGSATGRRQQGWVHVVTNDPAGPVARSSAERSRAVAMSHRGRAPRSQAHCLVGWVKCG